MCGDQLDSKVIDEIITQRVMSSWNKQLGFWGEAVAKRYLLSQGYQFVDQNVQYGHRELDLVMKRGKFLVVVEVKTKIDNWQGEPAELVTNAKLGEIVIAIEGLLHKQSICRMWQVKSDVDWHVDVVAVYGDGLVVDNIIHFENVTMWM